MASLSLVGLYRSALRHSGRAVSAANFTAAAAQMPAAAVQAAAASPAPPPLSGLQQRRRFLQSQAGLPPLPVPPLDATLDKYLRTVRPIVSEEELTQVEQLVEDFRASGTGEKLHQLLLAHAAGKDNWLSEWWVNLAYLECRDSVVINVNPGVRLPKASFASSVEWLAYSASLALGLSEFQRCLATGDLPVDKLRGDPLDMSQYRGLIGTCRLALPVMDAQLKWDGKPSRFMTVAYGNRFYLVALLRSDQSWEPLSHGEVLSQLLDIVKGHEARQFSAPPAGIGLLSSMQRDRWAQAKARLVAVSASNAQSMAQLERSAFLLCLDRPLLRGAEWARAGSAESDAEASGNMLHGWGLAGGNSGNRFFDKTLQVIVREDGERGFHYEHSPAEAVAVMRMLEFAFAWMSKSAGHAGDFAAAAAAAAAPPPCRPLDFQPYAGIEADLAEAETALQSHIDKLQLTSLNFDAYGKRFVASRCRLSPDAYLQVALQLAYYRLYQRHCATYESGSLRKFRLGRTETIRSCTPESAKFCLLMSQDDTQAATIAFREACRAHSLLTSQAVSGQGMDRHLLGLRQIARQHGLPPHPLFDSPAHKRAMHYQLSTSQASSETGALMCFGPVVPDGYGVCYNQMEDRFLVALTAYSDSRGTDSARLAASLRDSLLDIRDLMLLQDNGAGKAKL